MIHSTGASLHTPSAKRDCMDGWLHSIWVGWFCIRTWPLPDPSPLSTPYSHHLASLSRTFVVSVFLFYDCSHEAGFLFFTRLALEGSLGTCSGIRGRGSVFCFRFAERVLHGGGVFFGPAASSFFSGTCHLRLLADIKWFIVGLRLPLGCGLGFFFLVAGVSWQIPWGSWSLFLFRFLRGRLIGVLFPRSPPGSRSTAAWVVTGGVLIVRWVAGVSVLSSWFLSNWV